MTVGQTGRSKNVGFGAILVFKEGDTTGAVGVVFDSDNDRHFITLGALEVDETIFFLMSATDVTHRDAPLVVASPRAFLDFEEAFLGLGLGDFVESRKHFIAVRGGDGSEVFRGMGMILLVWLDELKGFREGRCRRLEADDSFFHEAWPASACRRRLAFPA